MTWAIYVARFGLAASFLSAVAGRFGLWRDGATFAGFEKYAGEVLAFLPASLVPIFARAATVCELSLGLLLLAGVWRRQVAFASAGLLAMFALAMTISLGPQSALEYSVWSACGGALLLAHAPARRSSGAASNAAITGGDALRTLPARACARPAGRGA